jgi:uncharacterized protein (DUF433 family)
MIANPLPDQAQNLLAQLSPADKARVLAWLAHDLTDTFPGIEAQPGVCGGEPCIIGARIPVWLLVAARRQGLSDADLLQAYPSLNAEQLSQAWAYARAHPADIDAAIAANENAWSSKP